MLANTLELCHTIKQGSILKIFSSSYIIANKQPISECLLINKLRCQLEACRRAAEALLRLLTWILVSDLWYPQFFLSGRVTGWSFSKIDSREFPSVCTERTFALECPFTSLQLGPAVR